MPDKNKWLVSLLTLFLLIPATVVGHEGNALDDSLSGRDDRRESESKRLEKSSGSSSGSSSSTQMNAETFFAACPEISVRGDVVVRGQATVNGDCAISLDRDGVDLDLQQVDLVVGALTVVGGKDTTVDFGDQSCGDGSCEGGIVDAASIAVTLEGEDTRARVFGATLRGESVTLVASGRDSRVRMENGRIEAKAAVLLSSTGTDASTRVNVVNQATDRNVIQGASVQIYSGGTNCETRVVDTDFTATTIHRYRVGKRVSCAAERLRPGRRRARRWRRLRLESQHP